MIHYFLKSNLNCLSFHKIPHQEQTEFKLGIKDNYVKIIEENIKPGQESQFAIQSSSYTFDVPYDGESVMHYGSTAFGQKVDPLCKRQCARKTTIEPKVCNNIIYI